MNYELNNEKTIRSFLLGRLSAAEEDEFEIGLLGNAEFQTALKVAEFDLIDDYVRGVLTDDEVNSFQSYFLNSSDRRAKLKTARVWPSMNVTQEVKDDLGNKLGDDLAPEQKFTEHKPKPSRRFFPFDWRWAVPLTAGIVLLIGFSGLILRNFFQSPVERAVVILKKAYSQERPIESRLSGFNYSPWVQRAGDEPQSVDSTLRDEAALILLGEVNNRPTPSSRQALGNLNLLAGKTDDAIKQLDAALRADPNNAQILNDFGAALMELAKTQKEKEDRGRKPDLQNPGGSLLTFGRANERFSQALQLMPNFAEAQFNQAICLQALNLTNQAIEAWKRYLQIDGSSMWAAEAQRKLTELEQEKKKTTRNNEQIIQDYLTACQSGDANRIRLAFELGYERTGNIVTARLLDEYLEFLQQGKNEDARWRIDQLAMAAFLEAQHGDLYTQDLLNFYRSISLSQREALVTARRLFNQASKLETEKDTEALPSYQQARILFIRAGSLGETAMTSYRIVRMHNLSYQYRDGIKEAEELVIFADRKRYQRLQADAKSSLASIHLGRNEYSQALRYSNQSLTIFENLETPNSEFTIRVQQALFYNLMGNPEPGLANLARSHELSRKYPLSTENLWFGYGTASDCFNQIDLLFTAVACEQEALQFAKEKNNQLNLSRSYAYIGELYGRLNNPSEAIAKIERARTIGESMSDSSLKQDIAENALLQLGHLYRGQGDWARSLSFYDESLRISERLQKDYDILDIHRGKLLVYLARHEMAAAQAELQLALSLFEKNVANIVQEDLRNSFFDTGQEIYDLAIKLADDEGESFNFSEKGRARTLLDLLNGNAGSPIVGNNGPALSLATPSNIEEIKERLPSSAQIVQYALLSDTLHIWVISRGSFKSISKPIGLNDLNDRITTYLGYLAYPAKAASGEAQQLSKELYGILIGSVESMLDPQKELCIVPDESLNYLPFEALIEPQSGKYLIEKFTVVYAPSSTVFLVCTDIAKRKEGFTVERALTVGNPIFDKEAFPQLKSLAAALNEATSIAEFYDSPRHLLSGDASEAAFRREAQNMEVIHIASHGIINTQKPEFSGILLTKENDFTQSANDGVLRAGEVLEMRLPRAKLVVLSACQTWLGRNYRGEGMVGLARSFIVADVPLVVASLWMVNSEPTGELMKSFHRHRRKEKEKVSTTQALRQAKLEMLHQPHDDLRNPNVWAAFVAVGGFANY